MRLRSSRSLMRVASNCRHVSGSDEGVTLLHLLCYRGRPGRVIGCHITEASATGNGTDFPTKGAPKHLLLLRRTHHKAIAYQPSSRATSCICTFSKMA